MRATLLVLTACALGIATPVRPAGAQGWPQAREGFWIGFGFGAGTLNWTCDACSSQSEGGPTGFLKLGGTVSKKVRLGAETNFWSLDYGPAKVTAGVAVFAVDWYPKADGGLFLTGGIGGSTYSRETASTTAESTSGAVLLGVGWDLRVGRNISITPRLTFWGSGKADLKDNSTVLETGLQQSAGTFQVGITFH